MSEEIRSVDLVVIGGGAAGMPAALEALEQGAGSVVIVDKRPVPGGNARMAGGFLFASDAYTQREAGVELLVLQSTVADYNAACASGHDPLFLKPAQFLRPLASPPYYVVKFSPLLIETIGPVVVNHHFQVLRATDQAPIPGLYAAGAITSGWQGHDYELWGANLGYAMASGRIAADHIVQIYLKREGNL